MLKKYSEIKLDFSAHELAWMKSHSIIKYTGDPDWLPFEAFNSEGEYIGIVAEYLNIIDVMLPITIEIIPSKSWPQSVKMAENNEVDMISETTDSKLSKQLIFTKAYIHNPIVIVMKNNNEYVENIEQIRHKKIVVIKDYGYIYKIKEKYPEIKFFEAENIQDALLGVSTGRYDAMIADLGLSSYSISTMGINNLNIVGTTEFNTQIGFGIRKDYAEFVGIINKAIDAVQPNDMQAIMQQWNVQKLGNLIDYSLIWKILFGTVLVAGGMFYWNRTMAVEIKKRKEAQEELRQKNKHIADSINYASLIQNAILPNIDEAKYFFKDFFVIWQPKDIVGGDIYLFEEFQNKNAALLMVIDCTGHGVPGAFMTMLVKAIERNIISDLEKLNQEVHPAEILQIYNKNLKLLLKQHSKEASSNAGFDGGIVYIDKNRSIVRFAGAQTPLFYFNENDELITIKGDRHGIGYISSSEDFIFTEHEFDSSNIKEFFITTDGYIDQNGGVKVLPFGKTRFCNVLKANNNETMENIKIALLKELAVWQNVQERNDDLAVIGVRLK